MAVDSTMYYTLKQRWELFFKIRTEFLFNVGDLIKQFSICILVSVTLRYFTVFSEDGVCQ